MGILGGLVVLRIGLEISILVSVVVRSLGVECFGFGFDSGFVVVEWFDGGYFDNEVVFGNGCFEEVVEYGRRQIHTEDFG